MILLVGHTAVACGVSIKEMTCSTDDADSAMCVKLGRVNENLGWMREPMNGTTNPQDGDFIPSFVVEFLMKLIRNEMRLKGIRRGTLFLQEFRQR